MLLIEMMMIILSIAPQPGLFWVDSSSFFLFTNDDDDDDNNAIAVMTIILRIAPLPSLL